MAESIQDMEVDKKTEQSHEQLLSNLIVLLKEVDWYALGTHLCVPQDRLKNIGKDSGTAERRLSEVIHYWLKNGGMSWKRIIEALKRVGGHADIIIIIESEHVMPGQQKFQEDSAIAAVSDNGINDPYSEENFTDRVANSAGGALRKATGSEQLVAKRVEGMLIPTKAKKSRGMDGSKEVEIYGEIYSLDVIPAAESKVVTYEKEKLLGVVDLKTLVDDLGRAGAFIRIAYNGVMAAGPRYTKLQIEIQQLGFDITKLCDESALTVSKFKRTSATVLNDLEATYGYLLDNKEDVAIETLSSVYKLAGDMEIAALTLHEKFEKQEAKARNTLKNTQTARGDTKEHIQEKEKEHQQLQIQLQHQQKLLDDTQRLEREAEAQRRQIEVKEDEAICSIKHIGPLKSLVNAIFRYEVFDEGTKKVDRWREKRIQALENERKLRKQRYEAMETMTSYLVMIQNCQSEQEMAKVAVDALHKTVSALQKLITVIMRAAVFWRQMQEHCRSLADDKMKARVKMIQEKYRKEELMKMWTSEPFKKQAVRFYASWVSLNSLCSDYVEHIKETQKDLYDYIEENPTYEESYKNVQELAKNFLSDLKKDQVAIAEKEFKDEEEIKAHKSKIN